MNTRLSEPTNRRTLRAMARFAAPFLAVLALLALSLSSSSPAQAQTAPVMTIYPPASVSEGAFGLAFSLEWDPGLIEDVTVSVEVSETGNMLAAGEAGIRSLPLYEGPFIGAEVLVQLDDDSVKEPDSVVTVTVLPGDGYTVGASGSVTVTDDDESATVTPEDGELVIYEKATANTSRPGTGHFVDGTPKSETYTIVLDEAPTGTVTVTATIDKPARAAFAANTDEDDDEVATKTLTFTASNWSVAQTVTVYVRATDEHEDDLSEDYDPGNFPQLVTVSHTAAGGGYDGAAIPDIEVTAYDAGNTVYYMFKDSDISVAEGDRYEFTVVQTTRNDIPWFFDTKVTVSTRGATAVFNKDYESENKVLWLRWYNAERVWDPERGYVWRNETTYRWETLQDQLLEGDEHFKILMERSSALDHNHLLSNRHGASTTSLAARITIVDDERPGRLLAIDGQRARPITEVSSVAEEGGSPATFTVALDRWPDNLARNATVKVNVLGPESFDESAGDNGALVPWKVTPGPEDPLVFNQNNWDTPRTVTVTALDDRDDRDELAPIALQLEVSAPFLDALEVLVRVEDDDKGAPPAVPGALTDAEAEALEGGGIKVSWTPPNVERHAGIDGYAIERSEDGADWSRLATPGFEQTLCGGGVRCYPDYTARPGYQSYYRVAGVNAGGTGPWTEAVSAISLPEVWLELVTTETETAPVEGTSLEYKLRRTGSAGALSVRVNISETGAMVARTYVEAAFSDGSAVKSFSIPTSADSTGENDSRVAANIELDLARYLLVQRESRPSSVAVWVRDDDGGAQQQGALLPEVTLTTAETAAAEGAALEFTLTRNGPTEEALGVDVRVSETGAMLAAFPSRAVIPAGQDSATFSVLTLDDEAVEADSVVTATLAEDAERYTVGAPFSASVTVMDDDRAPLTAEFRDAPASHDGEDAFALRIAFSEAVAVSYRTLRDHALEVTGGRVREAKRVDGRSDLWRITIEPDSDAEVTVVLPVTNDCDAEGAICTGDGGALSNRLELTVPGPVAEEDGQAQEQQQEEERTPPENSPATGAPAITGTARVGETLTADTAGIADEDGLDKAAFSHQWLADGDDIQGATGSTYTLQDADEGKAVTVRVSFDDDAGNQESLTSAATEAVEAAVAEEEPVEPPPAPTNLTAAVNADGSVTLTWDAPDDDSVTGYQVLRRRPYEGEKALLVYVENTGSTATVYTDADVTAGTQHVYRVKAVNEAGAGGQSNYVNVDVPDAEADDSASSDEPKPPSREEVPESDPEAEQQSARAENPRAPELVDSTLDRIRIRLFPVEGARRYEVTRIKLLRTGHARENIYTRTIQHSDAPIYTDHDPEWGRRYIYYYRAIFPGNSYGSYSNGSVKVTSEAEPHVTNRRIVRFKKSAGVNNFIWRLSYRWNAPTEDAVGDLLGYTVEQWYHGRVTVTEHGPGSTRWDGGFAAAPEPAGEGLGTQYRIKVRYSTGDTPWSPYTISCVDESECPETSYEEVGGYESS